MIKRCSIILLITLSVWQAFAQDKQQQPLSVILKQIEAKFDVTFTYADSNIKGIVLTPPSGETLTEIIAYLEKQTGLVFEILDGNFIAIQKYTTEQKVFCGFLLDSEDQEPIIGATIVINDKLTISDHHGYFELISSKQKALANIRSVGYKSISFEIDDQDTCRTILLSTQPITLQEVVVSNIITKGIDKKIDGVFVIKPNELGILPGLIEPDVLQAIQVLPGIQSINETVSDINVRGGTNDQNLVLWDGIKMYQAGHFFGLISAYNPYITQEVNLIKNGTTASLGDGISSTLDIHTDDKLSEKVTAGAGLNMINADIFFKIPISKKVSFHASSRRSFADVFKSPTYDQYFERAFRNTDVIQELDSTNNFQLATDQKFDFYDVNAKILYDASTRDKIRVNFINISNNIDYKENGVINNVTESKTSSLQQSSLASGITYNKLWSNRVTSATSIYLSKYTLQAINFDVENDQRLAQKNEVLDLGVKADVWIKLSDRFDLESGYQFYEVGISNSEEVKNPSFSRLIKEVLRSHVLFSEAHFRSVSGATSFRGGLRGTYYPKFDHYVFEPRLSFNQKLFNNLRLEILAEQKNQFTTQIVDFQNDFLGVEKRRWGLANNKDIPIIKSSQVSAGLQFQKKSLLISLEGYLKKVTDIITLSQGFQNQFKRIKGVGDYTTSGVDFLINKKFKKFSTWLSYAYADNNFHFPSLRPADFSNNLEIEHFITFGASYEVKGLQLSAGVNWHTGKPFTEPSSITDGKIIYNTPNSSQLAEYMRIDFSAKYNFAVSKKNRGQIGVSIWNIADKQNIIDTFYEPLGNKAKRIDKEALGLTPNISLRMFFN
jgi:hypothetical protein